MGPVAAAIAWLVSVLKGESAADRRQRRQWLRGEIPTVPPITEQPHATGDAYGWRAEP
jgi:hypothetical protein